jgi:FkbM family methyltransferase
MIFKNFKKIIPYKFKTFYKKNFIKFNGLKKIDEKMLKYINYDNGFYIEIGAHDGVHNANTLYFEKYKNWHGILIEPSPHYKFLIKNRSKKNYFFNNGCSKFNNESKSTLQGNGDYSFFKHLVDKKFLNHYSNKLKLTRKKISNTMVKIRTLNSILIESSAPKLIDFLSLDVEGMEIDVLKGVDFNSFNFKYLLIECSNQQKFRETNQFLTKKDYMHIDNLTDWDYLYEFKN